jgi:hypothetical protein
MIRFTHCDGCSTKLGRVTLFCSRCGRPYCSSACRSGHQARACSGGLAAPGGRPYAASPPLPPRPVTHS